MNTHAVAQFAEQNPEAVKEGQEQLQRMLVRSATDLEFRSKLLSDPRAAIAEFTGQDVPAAFDMRFVENAGTATLVLPDPIDSKAELSDADLEAVAGGITPTVAVTLYFAGGVAGGAAVYAIADVLT